MAIDNKAFIGGDAWIKMMKDEEVVDIMNNIADELCEKAKQVAPVQTGKLRDAYDVKYASSIKDKAALTNDTEYHDYVNDGTSKMAGRHMIETAIASISKDASKYTRKR